MLDAPVKVRGRSKRPRQIASNRRGVELVQAEIASSDIIARAICRRIDIDGSLQLAANARSSRRVGQPRNDHALSSVAAHALGAR
jgi:hypothetical protein